VAQLQALADRADRRDHALYDDLGMPGAQPIWCAGRASWPIRKGAAARSWAWPITCRPMAGRLRR
jgi:hypothetical protein